MEKENDNCDWEEARKLLQAFFDNLQKTSKFITPGNEWRLSDVRGYSHKFWTAAAVLKELPQVIGALWLAAWCGLPPEDYRLEYGDSLRGFVAMFIQSRYYICPDNIRIAKKKGRILSKTKLIGDVVRLLKMEGLAEQPDQKAATNLVTSIVESHGYPEKTPLMCRRSNRYAEVARRVARTFQGRSTDDLPRVDSSVRDICDKIEREGLELQFEDGTPVDIEVEKGAKWPATWGPEAEYRGLLTMLYKEDKHRLDWGCEGIVLLQHAEKDISGSDSNPKRQTREDVKARPRMNKAGEAPGGRHLKEKPAKTRRVQRRDGGLDTNQL